LTEQICDVLPKKETIHKCW